MLWESCRLNTAIINTHCFCNAWLHGFQNNFMIIQLHKDLKTQDLEEEFSLFYSYLKIKLEPVGKLNRRKKTGSIEITPGMTMDNVRELFVDELRLFPTFFRKKNKEWVDISKDSILTLKEENEIGRRETAEFEETRRDDFFETKF